MFLCCFLKGGSKQIIFGADKISTILKPEKRIEGQVVERVHEMRKRWFEM